jgi:CTP synthase (UTP-ammonia lyase)
MIITAKEAKDMLNIEKLTEEDLILLSNLEDLINKCIKEDYIGKSLRLPSDYLSFEKNPKTNAYMYFTDKHKFLLNKELENRFTEAGWRVYNINSHCVIDVITENKKENSFTKIYNYLTN